METEKFLVTDEFLRAFAGPQYNSWWTYMSRCDMCHTFIAESQVGYQDESRTECQDCSRWRARCRL